MGDSVIVFAGTSEGRLLYEFCEDKGIEAVFCVATEYGRQVLCETVSPHGADARFPGPDIRVGRMDETEMLALFAQKKPSMIIDATHPYAAEVTVNIKKAAEAYRHNGQMRERIYYRVLRSLSEAGGTVQEEMRYPEEEPENCRDRENTDVIYCADMGEAAAYLDATEGNILVTTGSRQLDELCKLKDFADRIYLRILPVPRMLQECLDRGFQAGHILCMQGPFSAALNAAMLREYNIRYLLTKQSGRTGGYPQKAEAAGQCGAGLVVILPPRETDGVSVEEMKEILEGIA